MQTAEPQRNHDDIRAVVPVELDKLLESPEFRQSEQSRRLLRHLVEVSLDGTPDQLRERAIGSALFKLDPGYDTAENPIVRVRVNELRKRLARYYQRTGPVALAFEIPARGYRVEFHAEEKPIESPATVPAPPRPRRWILLAGSPVLCAVALALLLRASATDPLEQFWEPALHSQANVILCSGHPVVYRFSKQAQERIQGGRVDHYQGQTIEFHLPPDATLRGADVVAMPDQYIGLGSAECVARINGWLQRHGKETDIRFGNDLTFTDLRRSPAVLVGAFQNRWTVEFMRGLRFIFDNEGGRPVVRDTQTGRLWGLPGLQENGQTKEDYVLISRVLRSPSGEFMIAGAGITQYGGHTVAEVLSDTATFRALVSGATPGWHRRNLQLLLKVNVIGKTAGPPELVALHEW